ncbi:polyketide synthase [Streptomyces violaceorubidus]
MAAYLCAPAVIHGEHSVKTSEIVAEVRDRHPDAAWAPRIVHGIAASTGIGTRGWMLPLEAAVAPGDGRGALGPPTSGPPGRRWPATGSPNRRPAAIAPPRRYPRRQTVQERTAPAWEAVQSYGERAARGALAISPGWMLVTSTA